jgi:peptidoglycan/xylan/chitin deacetylase (PgdA/CDA1 family)
LSQKIVPFQIAIGARTFGAAYPVRASFERAAVDAELVLPDHLVGLGERLQQPSATAPLGDTAAAGRALGRALFSPPLLQLLLRSAKAVARERGRLQLQLQIAPPELALLPWEWVTVGGERPWSPALRDEYALVRASRGAAATQPPVVDGPLRVLAAAAPGEELQLQALAAALSEPIRAGLIELRIADDATPATLERGLLGAPTHILHCAAPIGRTERGAPRLLLRRGMDLFDLAGLLADARSLRLVTLTGPQGDASVQSGAQPLLAASLVTPELPATVALGSALPARQSAQFAAACYASLAAGRPIDLAVTAGRRALADLGDGRSWGAPQLRLAPDGAQLFALRGRGRAGRLPRRALAAGAALALVAGVALGARTMGASATPAAVITRATTSLATAELPTPTATLPEPTATPAPPTPTAMAQGFPAPVGYATFLTGPGDTLDQVARRMGSDPAAIAALNHLDPEIPLRAERPLVIPVYTSGEAGAGGLVIRRGNPANAKVALTFDVEIDDKTLYAILDILSQRGVHGTFFVTGRWVMAYPDAARAIVAQGHEISNHSLTHPFFSRIGLDGALSELRRTDQIIHDTTGASSRPYFRFPYGDFTADTAALVAREGYVAYHWSADDGAIPGWLDWAAQHPAEANGGILLLHERAATVAALPAWLDRLAALGLEPGTLTDTLQ